MTCTDAQVRQTMKEHRQGKTQNQVLHRAFPARYILNLIQEDGHAEVVAPRWVEAVVEFWQEGQLADRDASQPFIFIANIEQRRPPTAHTALPKKGRLPGAPRADYGQHLATDYRHVDRARRK